MIDFLGHALREAEYDVPPHAKTPAVEENPPFTLALVESARPVHATDRAVRYRGHYYALAPALPDDGREAGVRRP
jgi:hypothetical protein